MFSPATSEEASAGRLIKDDSSGSGKSPRRHNCLLLSNSDTKPATTDTSNLITSEYFVLFDFSTETLLLGSFCWNKFGTFVLLIRPSCSINSSFICNYKSHPAELWSKLLCLCEHWSGAQTVPAQIQRKGTSPQPQKKKTQKRKPRPFQQNLTFSFFAQIPFHGTPFQHKVWVSNKTRRGQVNR